MLEPMSVTSFCERSQSTDGRRLGTLEQGSTCAVMVARTILTLVREAEGGASTRARPATIFSLHSASTPPSFASHEWRVWCVVRGFRAWFRCPMYQFLAAMSVQAGLGR